MTTTITGKQVDWFIPKALYDRLRDLHDWSIAVNFVGVSPSESDFGVVLLDDAVSRGEKVRKAYEKSQKRIVEPNDDERKVILA